MSVYPTTETYEGTVLTALIQRSPRTEQRAYRSPLGTFADSHLPGRRLGKRFWQRRSLTQGRLAFLLRPVLAITDVMASPPLRLLAMPLLFEGLS